jgi:hypothetical protein
MATRPRSRLPRGAYRLSSPAVRADQVTSSLDAGPSRRPAALARRSGPLRARLVTVLILAALLPLVATTIGGIVIARASLLSQGQQALRHRALASAATIDNYLAGLQSSLTSSSQEVGKLYAADATLPTNISTAIRNVLHTDSLANAFTASDATELIGMNGIVLVSDQSGEVGEDLHISSSVHAALGGASYTLSPVTFDPDGPSDLLETIEATVPVRDGSGGRVLGALRAHFSTGRFVALVQRDATAAGGGLLVERGTGLVLAQSLRPSARLLLATVLPANAALVANIDADSRLADSVDSRTIALHPIPGLSAQQLRSFQVVTSFSAGTIDGQDASSMLYVSVPIANSPAATPWLYLMGTSRAALTAPADQFLALDGAATVSLAQVAAMLGVLALLAAVVMGLWMSRWAAQWLTTSIRGLGETARAFLALSGDQRQTAEAQRQRLTTARGGLHELHGTAGELAESIERALSAAEHAQQARGYWAGQPQGGPGSAPVPGIGHWSQWAAGVRDRLIRQHHICTSLAEDVRSTGEAAVHMRERSLAINTQAMALEASLRASRSIAVRTETHQRVLRSRGSSRFTTRTLRVGLVGLLLVLGALPSLLLATTTTTLLRANLSQQSTDTLMSQAQSSERALNQLLAQQAQEVAGLETLYRSLTDPASGITPQLADAGLAGSVASAKKPLGTSLLEVADSAAATVVASSSSDTLHQSVAGLAVYKSAAGGRAQSSTSLVYSAPGQQGWYYIAAPLRSADLTRVIGVAIGQFSLQPLHDILTASDTFLYASSTYAIVIERQDGIIVADSRTSQSTFATTGPLAPSALQQMWSEGRYPNGMSPSQTPLAEVASQSRATTPGGDLQGVGFTGASGHGSTQDAYWLVPLSDAPWALLEAQPLAAANYIADRLTGYDLLLAAIVTMLATMLAIILGQSIIVPVQRLRARYRDAARRLVTATRRQEEAAHRQEAVLPPIESTAQLLTLETEEVGSLLFPPPPASANAGFSAPSTHMTTDRAWPTAPDASLGTPPPALPFGVSPPQQAIPTPRLHGEHTPPPLDALRRARVLANDWGLRQQRVLADLATALNATDQLSRASLEGEQEAAALAGLAVELLETAN